jgi:hypothetical protein
MGSFSVKGLRRNFLFLIAFFALALSQTFAQNINTTYNQTPSTGDCSFKTYTIGGWGTVCHGGNPGCYRDANFAAAFPNGVKIGCNGNTLTLTSSHAVQQFLPSGGTPAVLSGNSVDPIGSEFKNTAASQLIGVKLALGFDTYDPNFSASTSSFGDATITQGPFSGMTVNQFLAAADQVIGGCSTAFSISDVNETASAINESYDEGKTSNYLQCHPLECSTTHTDLICPGDNSGTITAMATGGTPPYSYRLYDSSNVLIASELSTNATSHTFTGLVAGNYKVRVTDATHFCKGCVSNVTITQPPSNPIVLTCPQDVTILSCEKSQEEVNASFAAWLLSFKISGGINPVITRTPDNPLAPLACGGTATVTWTVKERDINCGQPQTCTKNIFSCPRYHSTGNRAVHSNRPYNL